MIAYGYWICHMILSLRCFCLGALWSFQIWGHKLKFRGVMITGGESASSWLCLRCHDLSWSAHARIIQAGILEAGKELGRRLEGNITYYLYWYIRWWFFQIFGISWGSLGLQWFTHLLRWGFNRLACRNMPSGFMLLCFFLLDSLETGWNHHPASHKSVKASVITPCPAGRPAVDPRWWGHCAQQQEPQLHSCGFWNHWCTQTFAQ